MISMSRSVFDHVDNNHAPLKNPQTKNLSSFQKNVSKYFKEVIQIISDKSFDNSKKVIALSNNLLNKTVKLRKGQIKIL